MSAVQLHRLFRFSPFIFFSKNDGASLSRSVPFHFVARAMEININLLATYAICNAIYNIDEAVRSGGDIFCFLFA